MTQNFPYSFKDWRFFPPIYHCVHLAKRQKSKLANSTFQSLWPHWSLDYIKSLTVPLSHYFMTIFFLVSLSSILVFLIFWLNFMLITRILPQWPHMFTLLEGLFFSSCVVACLYTEFGKMLYSNSLGKIWLLNDHPVISAFWLEIFLVFLLIPYCKCRAFQNWVFLLECKKGDYWILAHFNN